MNINKWQNIGFNPRPRAGGDRKVSLRRSGNDVSIHAPARGATYLILILLALPISFNPRPRAGGDGVS